MSEVYDIPAIRSPQPPPLLKGPLPSSLSTDKAYDSDAILEDLGRQRD